MKGLKWLVVTATISLSGCSDEGVDDPERFFRDKRPYLETTVEKLQQSGIGGIWAGTGELHEYKNASKYYASPADEPLYGELQAFLRANGLLSIQVVRLSQGRRDDGTENHRFIGITFHVKQSNKALDVPTMFSIVFVAPDGRPESFFNKPTCKPLDAPAWHLCRWI